MQTFTRRYKSADPYSPLNGDWTPIEGLDALSQSLTGSWEYEEPSTGDLLAVTPEVRHHAERANALRAYSEKEDLTLRLEIAHIK